MIYRITKHTLVKTPATFMDKCIFPFVKTGNSCATIITAISGNRRPAYTNQNAVYLIYLIIFR